MPDELQVRLATLLGKLSHQKTIEEVKANWGNLKPKLVESLCQGTYRPGDIRRVWIPKAGGGERGLGIPNVVDRVVQEAGDARVLRLIGWMLKAKVAKPRERDFLGFSLNRKEDGEVEVHLSTRSKQRLRQRVKELTPRNSGCSMSWVITKINTYLKGWSNFFGIYTDCVARTLKSVDGHTRRRLGAIKLKQRRFILRYLVSLGASKERAGRQVFSGRKSIWKLSHIPAVEGVLSNSYWKKQGLLGSAELWKLSAAKLSRSVPKQMELCLG